MQHNKQNLMAQGKQSCPGPAYGRGLLLYQFSGWLLGAE
jgi:hypothetical protein